MHVIHPFHAYLHLFSVFYIIARSYKQVRCIVPDASTRCYVTIILLLFKLHYFKRTLSYKTFSASVIFFNKLLKSEFWHMKVPQTCTNAPRRSICSHIVEVILEEYLLTLQVKTDISFYLLFFKSLVEWKKLYLLAPHIIYFEILFVMSFANSSICQLFCSFFIVISLQCLYQEQ